MNTGMRAATLAITLVLGLTSTAALAQSFNAPPGQMNVWGAYLDRPQWQGGHSATAHDGAATGLLGGRDAPSADGQTAQPDF